MARVIIGLLILAGAWEWSGFLGRSGLVARLSYVVMIGAMLVSIPLLFAAYAEQILLIALVWWFVALIWTFFFPTRIPAAIRWLCGILVLVPLYVALMLLYAADPTILLFAMLIVWVADSGAYFAGKTMGRVKLAPRISPGKTWEGVIGGLGSAALVAAVTGMVLEVPLGAFVSVAMAASLVSVIGDLTFSMFKRNVGLKDSGRLLPGHGGVLDRIDSLAAAVPLFFIGLQIAGI